MPTKSKMDRGTCGARDNNTGLCIPMGTPCDAVGDSICSPVQSAFTLGVHLMEMNEDQTIHAFGLCPFCHGVPIVHKPTWFGRIFLHKGPSVTCNRCGAKLIAFHEGFTGEEIVIHYPQISMKPVD